MHVTPHLQQEHSNDESNPVLIQQRSSCQRHRKQARAGQCDGCSVLNGKGKKHGPLIFILHISFTGTAFVLSDKRLDIKVMASVSSHFLKHTLSQIIFSFSVSLSLPTD